MFPCHRNIPTSTTNSRATCTSWTTLAPRIGVHAGKCTLRSNSPLERSCVMDNVNNPENRLKVTIPVKRKAAKLVRSGSAPSGGA